MPSAAPAASAEGANCGGSNCLDEILSRRLSDVCEYDVIDKITSEGMKLI